MKIEQKTITTIVADEGKLLVRRSDGRIAGRQLTLGYNYYDASMPLSSARLETPDDYDEIDEPDDYEAPQVIDHPRRLGRMSELLALTAEEINGYNLTAEQAQAAAAFFPEWTVGLEVTAGERYRYGGKLYQCVQSHTTQPLWYPGDANTAALWGAVTDPTPDADGNEPGTLANPIPYEQGMILEQGKYYTQHGITYLCILSSATGHPYDLPDLPTLASPVDQ